MQDFKDRPLAVGMQLQDRDPRSHSERIGTIREIRAKGLIVAWNTGKTTCVKRDGISKRFELLPKDPATKS